ncbi:MAG TPA: dihydropteroate synthase [Actinomycetes bacterium]|nr:dihydropteroate synthase [Actinomycetes bacterium]
MQRTIGRRSFDFSRQVAVMAVVNRTPDSFYDRGRTFALDAAVRAAEAALDEGADWIDLGGVKAGPGEHVDPAAELRRVLPLLEAVRPETDAVVSVDTFRPQVAHAALAAGADVVNDPTALSEPELADEVAAAGAWLVVTHTAGPPRTRPHRPAYRDVAADVARVLLDRAGEARRRGVRDDHLIVDPGHDLHKNTHQSLEITRRLGELATLGYPLLVALSNKDFIGETLDLPVDQRLEGSLAALVASVLAGANIVRVHDVRASVRAVRMTEAILGWRQPARPRRGLA